MVSVVSAVRVCALRPVCLRTRFFLCCMSNKKCASFTVMSATRTCEPCTRTSDNKHWDCPPRMADGRLFTDYRPRCDINLQYRQQPMTGSFDYRQFLITNGEKVIGQHRSQAYRGAYAGPCVQPYNKGTVLPEKDAFVCDAVTCRRVEGDPTGLGTGRQYGMLPQQQAALDQFLREQEAAQQRLRTRGNCCDNPLDGGYHPLPGVSSGLSMQGARFTIPSGATPLSGGDPSVRSSA